MSCEYIYFFSCHVYTFRVHQISSFVNLIRLLLACVATFSVNLCFLTLRRGRGGGGIHTNVCNWPVFSEMISSWGVSTFACVDLATVWSRTRRFHTFFFFSTLTQQDKFLRASILWYVGSKHCFARNLKQAIISFQRSIFFASSARPGFYFEVTHGWKMLLYRTTRESPEKIVCENI